MDFYFMMEKKNYCQVALPAIHIAFDLQLYTCIKASYD